MPDLPYQKPIEGDSLPLPETWAATIPLKDYWRQVEAEEGFMAQLDACEVDEFEQDWLPGYDITDDR